jgi:hypothetical protein
LVSSPHAETRMLAPPPQLKAAYYSGIILAYLHCLSFPKSFRNNPPRPTLESVRGVTEALLMNTMYS